MLPIGAVLSAHEALDTLNGRLPSYLRIFADSQIASVMAALNVPALQTPLVLPFALSLVMQRLSAPWQIIRLAIKIAASDDEIRVAATSYGVAVTMALHDLASVAASLRADIKRGQFNDVAEHLKTIHDGVRGLRTELDLRNDSPWGKQLTSLRADISNALQSEIDSVPGRVRRLLRQRADKDISASSRLDPSEVDETADLIDFVAVCRTYASELAINEVTLRTFSDLQHYVEHSTEALVQSLRGADSRARAFRQQQVKAAIRFCDVLFGHDYASLMSQGGGERAVRRAQVDAGGVGLLRRTHRFSGHFHPLSVPQLSIAPACRPWCKPAHRRRRFGAVAPELGLYDAVVCVRADDGCRGVRRAVAARAWRSGRNAKAMRPRSTRTSSPRSSATCPPA